VTGLAAALAASLGIAGLSTVGDFVWAAWLPGHRAVYGLVHGALLFLAIGGVLGGFAGRRLHGAIAGAAIGFLAAGAFYVAAPVTGYSVMFAVWVGVWLALGILYARLGGRRGTSRIVLARGSMAALASGLAFYLISGIWRPFDPAGWDYALHFGAWTVAYFPGFAALLTARASSAPVAAQPV
jgi:hypothetical protein